MFDRYVRCFATVAEAMQIPGLKPDVYELLSGRIPEQSHPLTNTTAVGQGYFVQGECRAQLARNCE